MRGQEPKELARISRISSRRWEQYENHCNRENPVLKGLRFLRVFEQDSVKTYSQAAEMLGVSRQRLYQLIWLVTKLPREIKDSGRQRGSRHPSVFHREAPAAVDGTGQ